MNGHILTMFGMLKTFKMKCAENSYGWNEIFKDAKRNAKKYRREADMQKIYEILDKSADEVSDKDHEAAKLLCLELAGLDALDDFHMPARMAWFMCLAKAKLELF